MFQYFSRLVLKPSGRVGVDAGAKDKAAASPKREGVGETAAFRHFWAKSSPHHLRDQNAARR